jgi:hypothetical protein
MPGWYAIATGIGDMLFLHDGGHWGEADQPDLLLFTGHNRALREIARPISAEIGSRQPMVVRYPPTD